MQLLINILFFVLGTLTAIVALVIWAQYLKLKNRVVLAERAKQEVEDALRALDEQQKVATEALQNSLVELTKRRAQVQNTVAAPRKKDDQSSVKERLRRAVELTSQQSKIDRNKGPEFVMQHNELELEKLTVLKSILADGFDPVITIRFNTGDEDMLLSNYIQSITKGLA